jgi:hypothetical protein
LHVTTLDRHTRLATEQQLIRDATQRLLAGTPQRSNGSLSIATLATESGLPRHRIYEHHADLVAEFKAKTHTGAPITPDIQALGQQLADAHQRIHQLEATQAQLTNKITTLCAVITELTHDAHPDNVVALLRRHGTNEAMPPHQPHRSLHDSQRRQQRQQRDTDDQHATEGGAAPDHGIRGFRPAHPAQEPGDQGTDDPDRENQGKGKYRHGR